MFCKRQVTNPDPNSFEGKNPAFICKRFVSKQKATFLLNTFYI